MAPSILNRRTRRRGTGGSLPDPVATHTWASSAARSCCRNMSCRPGTATPDTVRTGPCRAHYTSGVTGRQASLPPVSNEVSHGNEPSAAVFVEGGWVGKGSILAYPGRAKSFRPGPIGAFEAQRMATTVAGLEWSRAPFSLRWKPGCLPEVGTRSFPYLALLRRAAVGRAAQGGEGEHAGRGMG